jgi:signal peptide peptidase SppA
MFTNQYARLNSAWYLEPLAFNAICEAARSYVPAGELGDVDGPSYRVMNGVAIVPIHGTLALRPDGFERRVLGLVDMDRIADSLERAACDPSARAIFLDINSPGGTVNGTPELASVVTDVGKRKQVTAFTDSLMASAAYYIGSQAHQVLAAPSASVGSIGVVVSLLDFSKMYADAGVKREVITNSDSPMKGMGIPGISLTKEQRAFLQARVEAMAAEFKQVVRASRSKVTDEAMNGGTFSGKAASAFGLIDGIAPRRAALNTIASALVGLPSASSSSTRVNLTGVDLARLSLLRSKYQLKTK